jgi:hypothetical protein
LASVVLTAAACGGGGGDAKSPEEPAPLSSMPSSSPGTPTAGTTKPAVVSPMKQLTSAEAVTALKKSGYSCGMDIAYAICKSGPVEVWVLAGNLPRFPVVSLHSAGQVETARAAIAAQLPKVLRTVHVNEVNLVADWYRQQGNVATAKEVIGDWRVALSAEEGSESPGVHLTLTDWRCTRSCQAE